MEEIPNVGDNDDWYAYQFDVRAPGEHQILNDKCSLEIQIYFEYVDDVSIKRMMGVCFKADDLEGDNDFIDDIIDAISEETEIDLMDAFHESVELGRFYEYQGSLTYPPCT